jgi:hypothetical protein
VTPIRSSSRQAEPLVTTSDSPIESLLGYHTVQFYEKNFDVFQPDPRVIGGKLALSTRRGRSRCVFVLSHFLM